MLAKISIMDIMFNSFQLLFIVLLVYYIFSLLKYKYNNSRNVYSILSKKVILESCNFNMEIIIFIVVAWFSLMMTVCLILASRKKGINTYDSRFRNSVLPMFIILLIALVGVIYSGFHLFKKIKSTKEALNNNNFFIYVDSVIDIEKYYDISSKYGYYLYFNFFYNKLDEKYEVSKEIYYRTEIGDEYYIVFIIPTKKIFIYKKGTYKLDYSIRSCLVDEPNIEYFIK